jgi:hypothetical protein
MEKNLLNTKEAAYFLGVKTSRLEIWRQKGIGPKFLKVGRKVFYYSAELFGFKHRLSTGFHMARNHANERQPNQHRKKELNQWAPFIDDEFDQTNDFINQQRERIQKKFCTFT